MVGHEDLDPFDAENYICGTPSLEEWKGLWRSADTDPAVTDPEFHSVDDQMQDRLHKMFGTRPGDTRPCYFRGDNHGDRTQYLEVTNPSIITGDLLSKLQGLLREPHFAQWRIMVVTYVDDASAIMIYPSVIRLGGKYDGKKLDDSLKEIIEQMRQLDL